MREAPLKSVLGALVGAATLLATSPLLAQTTLTIATVNNGDMIRMQGLTSDFTAKNPDIAVARLFQLTNKTGNCLRLPSSRL